MKTFLFALGLLLLAGCAENKNRAPVASASGDALVIYEKDKVIAQNHSYKFLEVGSEKKPVLIQVEERVEKFLGKDSSESVLTISAFGPSGASFDKKLWEKTYRADFIQFDPRYMRLIRNPRGENEDLSILLNYFSGEELIAFTGPNAFFAIPNQEEKRIVGFLARANDLGLLDKEGEDIVGNLVYASATEKKQTIHVRLKNLNQKMSMQKFTPGMMIKTTGEEDKVLDDGRTVLLGSLRDGFVADKITDIDIELIFYLSEEQKEVSVTIPIVHDKMDLSKAVYDKNIFVLEN
jgi:hypothetical protein